MGTEKGKGVMFLSAKLNVVEPLANKDAAVKRILQVKILML
jgi:hypothetical protein